MTIIEQFRAAFAGFADEILRILSSLPGLDAVAPVPALAASASVFTQPGLITLTGSATDNKGVVLLEVYRVVGTTVTRIGTLPPTGGTLTDEIKSGNGVTRQYRLVAQDAAGNKDTRELSVAVNIPPVAPPAPAAPTLVLNKTTAIAGATFTATLSQLQPGDQLDWGDGVIVAAAASLSHSYGSSGPYTVRVLRGGASAVSVAVTVSTPSVGITYDPPITIVEGGTYSGNWQSVDDFNIPAVNITTNQPVTILTANVRGKGDLIRARVLNGRITIRNVGGIGLNPNASGRAQGRFLDFLALSMALVENNEFEGTTGIYFNEYKGTGAETFTVRRNFGRNINGSFSDGNGGYKTGQEDFFRGQFVQFNHVNGIPGARIEWNRTLNEPRKSHVEDTTNLSDSRGASDTDRIIVRKNLFDGAFARVPESRYSGSGIALGDGEGQYQSAEDNTILECSNAGIFVSEGNNMSILRNTILGIGRLADGTYLDADSDAGIYGRDYSPVSSPRVPSSVFINENTVGWGAPTPSNPDARWDISIQDINGVPQATLGTNTLLRPGAVTQDFLDAARQAYLADLAAQSFVIGRTG